MAKPSRWNWIIRRLLPVAVFLAAGILLIVILGVAQRIGWLRADDAATGGAASSAGEIFTCPMHPQIRQPSPGRCPICGMALVPAASAATDLDQLSIRIEPAQRRLANIQTAEVRLEALDSQIQTVGVIAVDESRMATIASYIDGRIERLFADYTGVSIAAGDHLAVVYSPQLYAAQVEYLESVRALTKTGGFPAVQSAQQALVENTRQRLLEFGMTDEQLRELDQSGQAQSRLTIYAPQGGTVVEKLAVEGNYVKAGDPIYRIAELSTVWLMLKLFPQDAARIHFGQHVQAQVQSLPGQSQTGRVAFIDPLVDPKTRTVGVRVELLNDGRLRPGDYATAEITLPIGPQGEVYDADLAGKWISPMHPQIIRDEPGNCPICGMPLVRTSEYGFADAPVPRTKSLNVPRTAVLMAGGNSVVYVETKPGVFELRPITVGAILKDKVIVLEGLQAGEKVATAGNFLIDSQMQLSGKPSLIDAERAKTAQPPPERDTPLEFAEIRPVSIEGKAGEQLSALYAAYFKIQKALASDKLPSEDAVVGLHRAATTLSGDDAIPANAQAELRSIAENSEHLHHLKLAQTRQKFKPISHAVVTLASLARGEDDRGSYWHYFCSMVPGGGGDWLQADEALLNPYFGSEMLRCGEEVRVFKSPGAKDSPRGGLPNSPGGK
jgi:Cu(I)/Ag(I) efflux system membrane fusion protein